MDLTVEGYRAEPLGTFSHCFEVTGYEPPADGARLICWEFASGRSLLVIGESAQCVAGEGFPLGEPRAGGYCIEVGEGGNDWAGLLLPLQ